MIGLLAPFAAAIFSFITGLDSRAQVERMSDEDRARLEEQFGSIEAWISEVDLIAETGLPDLNLQGITEGLGLGGFGQPGVIEMGGGATLFGQSGKMVQASDGPVGTMAWQSDDGSILSKVVQNSSGQYIAQGYQEGQDILSAGALVADSPGSLTDDESLAAISNYLRENIPQDTDVLGDVNLDEAGFKFGDFAANANLVYDAESTMGRLEQYLADAQGAMGNLKTDFKYTAFLPEGSLEDPDVFRNAERQNLIDTEQANVANQTLASSRSLQESGILPQSATFQHETEVAPQLASDERFGSGLLDIESGVQDIIRGNAGLRMQAETAAQSINTQNALGMGSIMSGIASLAGQFEDMTQKWTAQQNEMVMGAMTEEGRQALAAAGMEINANHLTIQNDFAAFSAEMGITQQQLNQFNAMLQLGAGLGAQQMAFVVDLMKSMLTAEINATDSTILTGDIYSNALASGLNVMQALASMEGPKETDSSVGINIGGFGGSFGGGGCIAGFCMLITPGGLRPLRDIDVGDEVLASDGTYRYVLAKDYGPLPPEDRTEKHHMIVTESGSFIVGTALHKINGYAIQDWVVGTPIDLTSLCGEDDPVKTTVVYNEVIPYVVSGDLLLDGNADYYVDGFVVQSVAGAKMEAMMGVNTPSVVKQGDPI